MKTRMLNLIAGCVCGLFLTVQSGFAQGSLTPPGAPAPTMKLLDQIEPRTIVNAANTPGDGSTVLFIISQPGSYYLTGNIAGVSGKSGIEITANNVTLDLNGFALLGASSGNTAIFFGNSQTNITIRNGTISGWGGTGVSDSAGAQNLVLERLNISANAGEGIYSTSVSAVVRDCQCQNNGEYGIFCEGGIVSSCTVENNDNIGIYFIYGIVSGCFVRDNDGTGISAYSGTVTGCYVAGNTYDGIDLTSGTVSGCTVQGNASDGIYMESGTVSGCTVLGSTYSGIIEDGSGCTAIGNTCIGNNTEDSSYDGGISIIGSNNRVEDNHVTGNTYAGIIVYNFGAYINNIIIKNSVSGNGVNNYVTPNAQIVGPIITATGTIVSTSPWANFSY